MTEQQLRKFIFSLAWSPWSYYHYKEVRNVLHKEFPNTDFEHNLREFEDIILSKPGPGSPK